MLIPFEKKDLSQDTKVLAYRDCLTLTRMIKPIKQTSSTWIFTYASDVIEYPTNVMNQKAGSRFIRKCMLCMITYALILVCNISSNNTRFNTFMVSHAKGRQY
jgi:hypothetical protein